MALTKVTSGVRTLATDEVTATEIAAGAVGASEIASTFDISSKTVTLPETSVTAHVTAFDDKNLRNDIATLALHSAIADNKAAHNLSNSFIDQFEDATGVDVQTSTALDNNEFISTLSAHSGLDSYTKLLMHMDNVDGGTTITDSSDRGASTVVAGNVHADTTIKKFGTASLQFDGSGDHTTTAAASSHTDYCLEKTLDWTLDYWFYDEVPAANWGRHLGQEGNSSNDGWHVGKQSTNATLNFGHDSSTTIITSSTVISADTWYHLCVEHDDSEDTIKMWINGVLDTTVTSAGSNAAYNWHEIGLPFKMGRNNPGGTDYTGYLDEVRISKGVCRTQDINDPLYISTGTGFSVPTSAYSAALTNATGNFTSATQAAVASVSSMGIVVLYKDNAGTASLNSDLVAQVSANGGTNYANATLVAGGTFSTGIKIAAVSGVSVTAGTTPKYKISFANQSSGSKETRIQGVALLY